MSHPITFFQIVGRDGKALQKFYKKVFDWKLSAAPEGPMMMVAREKGGIAGGVGTSQSGSPSVAVYADCDNLEKHLKSVEKAGGKTAMPPMDLPGGMGRIAGF